MSKQTRYYLNALFLLVLLGAATAADAQVDQQRAQAYFKEAQALCERDGGKLWGISLCGPMVFTDVATKTIATSQPAPDGPRPGGLWYLNAPVTWGGTRWSAYMWAWIPHSDAQERGRLFIHELFHRIQAELKLMAGVGENDHLDTVDGRYWIQLEWRALSRALTSSGAARAAAIRDALAFRRARQTAFPGAAAREAAEEIREGLAEYTGIVVATSSTVDAVALGLRRLAGAEQEVNFVQRFHAASGPAYGLLLDAFSPGWTRRVTASDDLAQLLTTAAKLKPARDAAVSATRYHSIELRTAEEKRDVEHKARVAELKARFVDRPVLIVPRPTSSSINTLGSTPIPDIGLVIMEYRATPSWGSLTATSGVLVLTKGAVLHLTTPFQTNGSTLSGEGWTITLAAGWMVHPGKRQGDFEIVKQQPEPAPQPSVTKDVVYGHKDGLALTLDVHRPARPNGAGLISIVSGGWQSSVQLAQIFSQAYPPLNEKGFTVFAVRHGSWPRYPLSSIVADMRRSVRFIRQHAKEYGVDPNRLGVFGNSAGGHLALLLGTTGDSGDPSAADPVLRESSRVAAVVANYPPTDLARWATEQTVFKFTEAEAAQFSPIRFVSSGSAPSLIVHGDADMAVPIDQGETMHAALTKAGVPASFIRIKGAGHGFEGAAPTDLERAYAAMMQWFEQHLRAAAK